MEIGWRVGEVTITKVVELEAALPGGGAGTMIPSAFPDRVLDQPWLVPDWADEAGNLRLAMQAILIETPSARLVVDTCAGNGKTRRNPLFHQLDTPFLAAFADVSGWSPADVDAVVCTHLHGDHVGWNTTWRDGAWVPTFPHARYHVGRVEHEHWLATGDDGDDGDAGAILQDSIQPVVDAGLLTLVETDASICPEVTLVPTPGHTPGHASVVVESRGQQAIVTGDLLHHPCQVGRPDWHSDFDSDPDEATRTRRAFLEQAARSGALVIGTHFGGPTAGRVVAVGEGLRLEAVAPAPLS